MPPQVSTHHFSHITITSPIVKVLQAFYFYTTTDLDDVDEADDVGVFDGDEEADLAVEAVAEARWEAGEPHLLHSHRRASAPRDRSPHGRRRWTPAQALPQLVVAHRCRRLRRRRVAGAPHRERSREHGKSVNT